MSNIVVKSLTLSPASVTGGTPASAKFTLAAPVGVGGGKVTIASSNPAEATVQPVSGAVLLRPGATEGSFSVRTKPLKFGISRTYATIMAGEEGTIAHARLTITS
jgi:hypothetical protein